MLAFPAREGNWRIKDKGAARKGFVRKGRFSARLKNLATRGL
jgi:hypothetical protein